MAEPADKPPADRRTRDRAIILPVVGAILLVPPVAGIFRLEATILGIPATLAYVFGVWALLIAAAALLSRRLRAADPDDD